uniref:Uncharacterized protein n=1 Tax=Rhizophora mucronata TaxID=61149 RepID=A0A2P2Q7V8_RHIMU
MEIERRNEYHNLATVRRNWFIQKTSIAHPVWSIGSIKRVLCIMKQHRLMPYYDTF